jgi:hypothetical protein
MNMAITQRFTHVNAVKAPKLMKEVEVATLSLRAMSPTAPASSTLIAGVWNLGWR